MEPRQRIEIDIAPAAIFKVVFTILLLLFLREILDILVLLFFVIVLSAALTPIVDRWSHYMRRSLAALLVFLCVIGVILISVSLLIPPFLFQLHQFSESAPALIARLQPSVDNLPADSRTGQIIHQSLDALPGEIQAVFGQVPSLLSNFIGGFYAILVAAFLTFYLLLEERGIKKFFLSFVPFHHKSQVVEVFSKIGDKMGDWLRGQLLVMLAIFVVDWIGLLILGVPFSLTLALWAGLTEVIPFLGPVLGAIPAVLIALAVSPWKALFTLILFVLVQQIEGNFLVPKIMEKTIGLSPLTIILALIIGGKLLGILGIILSVPIAAALSVIVAEWPSIWSSIIDVQLRQRTKPAE